MIYVAGVIISFIVPIFIFFMFILEAETIFWLVNYTKRSILYLTSTAMVSFFISFLVEVSIIRRSLYPIGNLAAPITALFHSNIFFLVSVVVDFSSSFSAFNSSIRSSTFDFHLNLSLPLSLLYYISVLSMRSFDSKFSFPLLY